MDLINQREMAQINLFREAIDVCQLCDLGYIGLSWTFERRVQNGAYCRVRLDRAFGHGQSSYGNQIRSCTDSADEQDGGTQPSIALDRLFIYEKMWVIWGVRTSYPRHSANWLLHHWYSRLRTSHYLKYIYYRRATLAVPLKPVRAVKIMFYSSKPDLADSLKSLSE